MHGGADAIVPAHFFGEAGSALRRMELRGDLKADRASLALRRILALRLRQVDTKGLMIGAWQLRANIILPDALYVVLARALGAGLVTADDRLARAPGLGIQVIT